MAKPGFGHWALSGSPEATMAGFCNLVGVSIGPHLKNWLLSWKFGAFEPAWTDLFFHFTFNFCEKCKVYTKVKHEKVVGTAHTELTSTKRFTNLHTGL
jgi:hypothetical protein